MLKNTDIKNFLSKHRSKIKPEEYGFGVQNRRVKGLRREEVAQLAAVSVSWYTWLEQGRNIRISPAALARIGKVLKLSSAEQSYLNKMVFGSEVKEATEAPLPQEIIAMVKALNPHPAFVRRENMDIVYWNEAAAKDIFDWSSVEKKERNSLKLMFTNDEYRKRIFEWEKAAIHSIAAFRAYYAKSQKNAEFSRVLDELISCSQEFHEMWERQDVNVVGSGEKKFLERSGSIRQYSYTSLEVEQVPGTYVIFYLETPNSN